MLKLFSTINLLIYFGATASAVPRIQAPSEMRLIAICHSSQQIDYEFPIILKQKHIKFTVISSGKIERILVPRKEALRAAILLKKIKGVRVDPSLLALIDSIWRLG